jgi:hypothetical protein
VQTVVGIAGLVDVPAFQWAVDRVLREHPQLLRGFGRDAAGREISVRAGETPRVREVDLREYSAFERDEAALRLEEHERCEEFPLGAPPLIRLLLLRVGEREQRFVVTSHRAVLDDWSHAVLVRAMLSAHGWNVADDGDGDGDGANGGSWSGETADGGPLARLTQRLPWEFVGRVLGRAAEYGIDAEMIVQGAWAVALSGLTGRQDVLFGGVSPGQSRPILASVQPDQSMMELLLAVRERSARLGPHQQLGAVDLFQVAGPRAWFGTVALLAPEPIGPVSPRLGAHIRTLSTFDAKPYALSFSVTPGARWTARLDYRTGAVSDRAASDALTSAVAAIEAIAYTPELPLAQLQLATVDVSGTLARAA